MASYLFTDLLKRAPAEIRNNVADARTWLNQNIQTTVTPGRLLRQDPDRPSRISSRPNPGTLNMFLYDAKTKAKLPYFDRFPLILYAGSTGDGFTGLNLHYLPPLLRARLFDSMYQGNPQLTASNPSTGLAIATASRLKYYKPCFKRYLNSNVRSRFVQIYPEEWNLAIFLPTERFSGGSKGEVFSDTIGKIG